MITLEQADNLYALRKDDVTYTMTPCPFGITAIIRLLSGVYVELACHYYGVVYDNAYPRYVALDIYRQKAIKIINGKHRAGKITDTQQHLGELTVRLMTAIARGWVTADDKAQARHAELLSRQDRQDQMLIDIQHQLTRIEGNLP